MAYAPYTNDFAAHLGQPVIRGCITNEYNVDYQFIDADPDQHPFPGYPHQIFVGPGGGEKRYCKIIKTRVYVVVDEDGEGNPVEEKWLLKKRRDYQL